VWGISSSSWRIGNLGARQNHSRDVKGDVHDIGKNLVEIILSNNGYT